VGRFPGCSDVAIYVPICIYSVFVCVCIYCVGM